ncbi:cathelicidin-2 [Cyrtonyx montezumae]|uniref:cathelicidin-2 n=1 Tax=Cyrtonyx montezumae TaxID=9017 RepID=UPI0032DAECCA
MPSCWVLLLALLGGGCALPAPMGYPQALSQAVDSYNQRPEVQNAFRLLSADPEPGPGIDLSTVRALNFTIMETDCAPRTRVPIDDCNFKDNGAIKDCSGPVSILQDTPEIDLHCRDASSDPLLVQRGRFGRFLGKIRHFRPRFTITIQGGARFG